MIGRTLLPLLALTAPLVAQNPEIDEPHQTNRQVTASGDARPAALADAGATLLEAGRWWDAWRCFRELCELQPDEPLGFLGRAAAARGFPMRTARFVWEAQQRFEEADAGERSLIEALVALYDVTDKPTRIQAKYNTPPSLERRRAYAKRLETHGSWSPTVTEIAIQFVSPLPGPDAPLGLHAAHKRGDNADDFDERNRKLLARMPRYPNDRDGGPRSMPSRVIGDIAGSRPALSWLPQPAPSFSLPRGLGGKRSFDSYEGKPLLIVFYMGMGCVHCVAQIHELMPRTKDFEKLGIQVVAIGIDSVADIRASYQMATENGDDPIPFDVLSDPKGESFRAYGAWDDYDEDVLHGTFLVDAKRRILWQDISSQPFMDTDFLLKESERMLGLWKDAPTNADGRGDR